MTALTNGLYDQTYRYAAPTDLKKDRVVAVRPQDESDLSEVFVLSGTDQFDRYKTSGTMAVEDNNGVRTLRISKSLTAGATLHTMDSITANGTWAASGDASNLEVDTVNKVSGSGSLRFDLAAAGSSGLLTNSTMTAVDLSTYGSGYSGLMYVYVPSTAITAVTLRWGSDASNYYSSAATTTHDGVAISAGWNLFRFDRASATTTGTPVTTAIDYARLAFTYDGTATLAVKVDALVFRIPTPYDVVYYSKCLFKNSSGTRIAIPTADTDTVELDSDGISCLLYEAARLVSQEIGGEDSAADAAFFRKERDDVWAAYKTGNPSASRRRRNTYYRY